MRIRFDIASQVMCPKFHLDAVPARLLCTYRGTGTEYVPENQQSDISRIQSIQTGSVALFRGATWPSGERTCLLHRSPAIGEGGKTRLLVVVDPLKSNF
ncbi:MAG: DUF1826 domain-containing protein [Roseibium sp.]|nr:DUF1826 domain-containing protein [Roseibium sp.]